MATTDPHPRIVPATGDEAKPYDEQIPFMGRDRPYYGFISGSGAGKTFAGVYRLWLNATLWNPDSMGAIIVPDKSQFTDNVKPIMKQFGLMDKWEYNSVYTDEPGLVTNNDQRILILSADNERQIGRIKGKNLAYVWMDEEAEIPPRAREVADQRLRVGNYPNLFITTTPSGKNHTYDFFKGEATNVVEKSHKSGNLIYSDDKLAIVGVPSEANPAIDDEDIARMRRNLPEKIVAQEIEGQFVEIGSGVFTKDMLEFATPDDLPDRDMWKFVVGVGVGVEADSQKARDNDTDYWAASLLMQDTYSGQVYLIDCRRERGLTLQQGVEWLQGVISTVEGAEVYIESNQSQRWLKQSLEDRGINARAVMNTSNKEDRLIQLTLPLERGDVQFLNREIDEQLGYDPRFKDLISEMMSFPEGSHDDLLDSLEIAVNNINIGGHSIVGGDIYGRDT